ncbi:hypothetical protein E2C01_038747 [Portunus trituberculatus]|uniref:Uncharacterized protein n=1 Tax=Portunus trituberculatus TaxID=210409 RepID=A0A5B7FEY4_PORTR|nr:hypothetical protein [Portunus trituberculatus]
MYPEDRKRTKQKIKLRITTMRKSGRLEKRSVYPPACLSACPPSCPPSHQPTRLPSGYGL